MNDTLERNELVDLPRCSQHDVEQDPQPSRPLPSHRNRVGAHDPLKFNL
jgi:hypothetical protein